MTLKTVSGNTSKNLLNQEDFEKALSLLVHNRRHEFAEIAEHIGIPQVGKWEQSVLEFSLGLNKCFHKKHDFTQRTQDSEIQKCYSFMVKLSKERNISQVVQIFELTYKISEDFESIFQKIKR